jgi:transposase
VWERDGERGGRAEISRRDDAAGEVLRGVWTKEPGEGVYLPGGAGYEEVVCGTERSIIGADPLSGHPFCFFNRSRNYLKLLFWDRNGYCIVGKKLTRGTYAPVSELELNVDEMKLILDAYELKSVRRRKCYEYLSERDENGCRR